VFGDRESGAFLHRFAWTKIVRHDLVKGRASPDDPALAEYWAKRRRKNGDVPPIGGQRLYLLRKQQGRCPVCNGLLLHAENSPRSPEEWEQWARVVRKAIKLSAIAVTNSSTDEKEQRLVHEHCRRRKTARDSPV
jgi:RNA-directed DNA polymerase